MTHDEAIARCAQLNADDSTDGRWFPKQVGPEAWEIVRTGLSRLRSVPHPSR